MNLYPNRFKIIASAGSNIPLEVTAVKKGTTAFISISGNIYKWSDDASSKAVDKSLREFVKSGAINAELYINSGGGDCFEANEIDNIISKHFKPENVKVRLGAVAASAATVFIAKYFTTAKKNTQIMIHKPMGNPSGNEDKIEAQLELIKNLTNQYRTMYAAKMGIEESEVEKKWKNDYWLTAAKAKSEGLIDEIEDEDEKIDATAHFQLVACGAPNIPKIENTKTEIKRMELSVLAVKLGLPANATQAQVDAKLDQVTAAAATADSLVQAAADQKKADKSAKVKALLDGAEKDKKITAAQRPQWELIANGNLEAATTALGGLKSITAISAELTPGASAEQTAEQANWTYADYLEKDQGAFEKLPEAKQTALVNAHYKEN
jgi:ATP-dependent protease ClpP protease subunit